MNKTQLVLSGGTLLLALGLLWFDKKTNQGIETSEIEQQSIDPFEWQAEYNLLVNELDQSDKREYDLLIGADSLKQTDLLKYISLFWQTKGSSFGDAFIADSLARIFKTDTFYWERASLALLHAGGQQSDTSIKRAILRRAAECSREVLILQPNNIDVQADALLIKIKLAQVPMKEIVALRELANQHPESLRASLYMGELSIESGQFEKAEGRYRTVMERFPERSEAYFGLAQALYNLDKKEECSIVLQNLIAVSRNPQEKEAAKTILEQL